MFFLELAPQHAEMSPEQLFPSNLCLQVDQSDCLGLHFVDFCGPEVHFMTPKELCDGNEENLLERFKCVLLHQCSLEAPGSGIGCVDLWSAQTGVQMVVVFSHVTARWTFW